MQRLLEHQRKDGLRRSRIRIILFILGVISLLLNYDMAPSSDAPAKDDSHIWNENEVATLRSLWIGSLPELPKDPSNKYADDLRAAVLGKEFFHDNRLSGNLKISCSTCHPSDDNFVDHLPRAHGMGLTTRRTMSLIGVGYNTWFFWDGRADSLWGQALAPPESSAEHGITRTFCAHLITDHYKDSYQEIFGALPKISKKLCPPIAKPDPKDSTAYKAWMSIPQEKREEITRIYVNMGKAIAAYVRRIVPGPSRFDRYVEALLNGDDKASESILNEDEIAGLKLFIGKAKCINCHNGPLFTNGEFHKTDVPQPSGLSTDPGRAGGITKVINYEFNCLSKYSDAKPNQCLALRFINRNTQKYGEAFKTPTLRNVADRGPYMHAGQLKTLREVLAFYNFWPDFMGSIPELEHTSLTNKELKQIEAFLKTLTGPILVLGVDQTMK